MGLIINSTKMGMPYINGVKHNAYINGQKMWNSGPVPPAPGEGFQFVVADAGSFSIPCSGVLNNTSAFRSYNWRINWGDGSTETASGTSSDTKTIPHTYSDGRGTHTITIYPNGTATTGWFDAYCSGGQQDTTNLAKIKQLNSPINSLMRTLGTYSFLRMFYKCTGLTSIPENLLPSTTVGSYYYAGTFNGCTGLTSIPENLLPATTLLTRQCSFRLSTCLNMLKTG
jgi:hypothetical protein